MRYARRAVPGDAEEIFSQRLLVDPRELFSGGFHLISEQNLNALPLDSTDDLLEELANLYTMVQERTAETKVVDVQRQMHEIVLVFGSTIKERRILNGICHMIMNRAMNAGSTSKKKPVCRFFQIETDATIH